MRLFAKTERKAYMQPWRYLKKKCPYCLLASSCSQAMPKLRQAITILLFSLLTLYSCDRIKRKGKQVRDETKAALTEKKEALADRLITRFELGVAALVLHLMVVASY